MKTRNTDIGEHKRLHAVSYQGGSALLNHGLIGGSARSHHHTRSWLAGGRNPWTPDSCRAPHNAARVYRKGCLQLVGIGTGHDDRPGAASQELGENRRYCFWGFPRPIDRFGGSIAELSMMIDLGMAQISEGQTANFSHSIVG